MIVTALIRPLWAYRGFVLGSVWREFQARYRGSMLGAAWTILNPLAMILIYTLIFSRVMGARLPGVDTAFGYSIYLCAGILVWGLFVEIVTRAQNVFMEHANLIKKISFPRICLPVVVILTALINFAIMMSLFLSFLLLTGNAPGWPLLALIPVLAILLLFSIGMGMTAGVLHVFFRDVGPFLGILTQFWFWLTPIVYPASVVPDWARILVLDLNPLAPIIGACQTIFVANAWPDWAGLLTPLLTGLLLCALGVHLFRTRADDMVDEL